MTVLICVHFCIFFSSNVVFSPPLLLFLTDALLFLCSHLGATRARGSIDGEPRRSGAQHVGRPSLRFYRLRTPSQIDERSPFPHDFSEKNAGSTCRERTNRLICVQVPAPSHTKKLHEKNCLADIRRVVAALECVATACSTGCVCVCVFECVK